MASNIERRRVIRAIEAKRDKLLITGQKTREQLAVVRTELKAARKR